MRVNITSKNGVTLKTAEKYVAEDIAVGLPDADAANLTAWNIKKGVTILGVTGTSNEGINPSGNINITGTSAVDVTNYATATVSDADLVASNIKSGVNILGITGTHVGGIQGVTSSTTSGSTTVTVDGNNLPTNTTNITLNQYVGNVNAVGTNSKAASITYNAGPYAATTIVEKSLCSFSATNLDAANIKKGITILGKAGTYTSDATAAASDILSGKTAYVNGSKVTGSIASLGATSYTPTTSDQTISSGKYLSGAQTIKGDANLLAVNIKGGTSIFGVSGTYTSDATCASYNMLKDTVAYKNGTKITGTIPTKTSSDLTSSGLTVNVPSGYYSIAASKTASDSNLVASNIKSGTTIFGVTGTYNNGIAGVSTTTSGSNTTLVVDGTKLASGTNRISTGNFDGTISTMGTSSNASTVTIEPGMYSAITITPGSSSLYSVDATNFTAANIAKGVTILNKTGTYTSDANAVASNILSGKTAYVNGVKLEGTMTARSSSDVTASGAKVSVPAGYYSSAVEKSVGSGSATTPATTASVIPSISVSSSGLITASNSGTKSITPSVVAGYVTAGTAGTVTISGSGTKQLTTKAAATYTPSTTDQTIASGTYLTGAQTIKGDGDLVVGNIKSGVEIFGVKGTFTSDADATAAQILSGKTAYVNGTKVTGTIATKTSSNVTASANTVSIPAGYYASAVSKTVGTAKAAATYTPTTSNQTIKAGYYLSGDQTIKGDANLVAANIKSGTSIFGVTGTYDNGTPGITKGTGPFGANDVFVDGSSTGTISGVLIDGFDAPIQISNVQTNSGITFQNVQASYLTIDGASTLSISTNANDFGTPSISATNLTAANIKKGVSILGTTGTYTSDATATASQILSGKTAYVNGSKITGNIASLGATTYTPKTTNQTIASGKYLSGTQTIKGDANLVASNIKSGVSIFGVSGTYTGGGSSMQVGEASLEGTYDDVYFEINNSLGFFVCNSPHDLVYSELTLEIEDSIGSLKNIFISGEDMVGLRVAISGNYVIAFSYSGYVYAIERFNNPIIGLDFSFYGEVGTAMLDIEYQYL